MSLKLILPMAGSVGMIASVAGVSTSSYRSGSSANNDPTHKWKIEIPNEIEVVLDCSGIMKGGLVKGGMKIDTRLTLSWFLDESDYETLWNGGKITRNGDVEFVQKGSLTKIWPIENGEEKSKLTVTVPNGGKKIQVEFSKADEGGDKPSQWTDSTFICKWDTLIREKTRKRIYFRETQLMERQWVTTNQLDDLKAEISLTDCKSSEKTDKKTATCDLKVVTGTDLDWSTKVKAKAKFTIV